jgi:hypothetical protein
MCFEDSLKSRNAVFSGIFPFPIFDYDRLKC